MGESEKRHWFDEQFNDFITHLKELDVYRHLSMAGAKLISLNKLEREFKSREKSAAEISEISAEIQSRREEFERLAEELHRLIDKITGGVGEERVLPALHQQSCVALWGALESFVHGLWANWLAHESGGGSLPSKVRNISITLANIERMSREEIYYSVVKQLEQKVAAGKRGASRFEEVFKVIGLSGPIETSIKKDLLELSQVRNVIVHRRGIIDRQFTEVCPWLKMNQGDSLVVTQDDYLRYRLAAGSYVRSILRRVGRRWGKEMTN